MENKMKSVYKILTVFLFLVLILPESGFSERPLMRQDLRALSMGGAYSAFATGTSALYYNPAMLNTTKFHMDLAAVQILANKRAENLASFIFENQDKFENFDSLSTEDANQFLQGIDSFDDRYIGFGVSPIVGLTFPHFGVAAYGNLHPSVKLDKGIYVPRIYMKGHLDAVVAAGLGFRLPLPLKTVYAGVTGKYIQRYELDEVKINATEIQNISDMATTMLDTLREPSTGIAFDLGLLVPFTNRLDLGVTLQDIGSVGDEKLPTSWNAGFAYYLKREKGPFVKSLVITGDIRDAFNAAGNSLFNHLHFGTELRIPLFSLRAGINQGYATFGAGFRLLLFQLDYAYVGEEFGQAPGWQPEFTHMAQLRVGF